MGDNKDLLEFKVRDMLKEDIPQVMDIHRENDWHVGDQNVYTWHEFDPQAFKVAVTESGQILAVCAAIRHYENFYFLGFYIVQKKYRSKGIGWEVWKSCMEYVGQSNAGLNSVPEMTQMYLKGFPIPDDNLLIQEYETLGEIQYQNLLDQIPEDVEILAFHETHLPYIFEYDYKLCGYERKVVVELSCKEKNSLTMVAFKNSACVGFGTVQRSVLDVPHIGPLYADEACVAEAMLRRMLMSYPLKKGFSIVTYANNKVASDWMKKIGCPQADQLPRLYLRSGVNFSGTIDKVFGHFDIYFSPI